MNKDFLFQSIPFQTQMLKLGGYQTRGSNCARIAAIVADPWLGLGLGPKLIDSIIEICRNRQIATISAKIHSDNNKAIRMMKEKDFDTELLNDGTMKAVRDIRQHRSVTAKSSGAR